MAEHTVEQRLSALEERVVVLEAERVHLRNLLAIFGGSLVNYGSRFDALDERLDGDRTAADR